MNENYEKCWNDLKNGILLSVQELIEAKQKKLPIPDPELQLMVIQRLMYAINELEIKYGIQGKTQSPIITA